MQPGQISARAVAKTVLIALLVAAAALLLVIIVLHTRTTLRWLFTALFLAVALNPAVDLLAERKIAGRVQLPRWVAILLVYVAFIVFFIFVTLLVIPPIVSEVEGLAHKLPQSVHSFEHWAEQNKDFRKLNRKYDLTDTLAQQAQSLPPSLSSAAGDAASLTVKVLRSLLAAITILVVAFFLLIDGKRQGERLLAQFQAPTEERLRRTALRIYKVVKGYLSVNLLLAVASGAFTWVLLELLGVDLAIPLAVLMVFFDLIPLVGLTVGGLLIAVVAALHDFPTALIVWVVAFLIYQQLQDRVIQPLMYKNAVQVHPVVAIASILIGADLLGILGALLAIPAAASIGVVIDELWRARRESREGREAGEAVEPQA